MLEFSARTRAANLTRMAEDLVDRVASWARPCLTRDIPLGLHGPAAAAVRLAGDEAARLGLPPGRAHGWCSATATTGGRRSG